ncbi:MAG: peptidase M48 [Gammaproteobacteria bacterium]|nr:MAG: peptidase M48 [Gammaproteobacteria bacterium]
MARLVLDGNSWRDSRVRNRVHSLLLLAATLAVPALAGWLLWGLGGLLLLGFGVALLLLWGAHADPARVLRLFGGRPLTPARAPGLYGLVQELADRAGLPRVPRLYLVSLPMVNAFAVGHADNAALAVTPSLLDTLDRRELAGVLAHEIAHVRNGDLRLLTLAGLAEQTASLLAGLTSFSVLLSLPWILVGQVRVQWLPLMLLLAAPHLATLLARALSRVREFGADLVAVALTGDPEGLARALARLEWRERSFWRRLLGSSPLKIPYLLRTHPDTDERIRRLAEVSRRPTPIFGLWHHPGLGF